MKCGARLAIVLLITVAFVLPCSALPASAVVNLRTASGETAFHIGERISLRLTFSSPDDTSYEIVPLVETRRGEEFDCNRFIASPASGWSDPLATYFKQDFLLTGHGWGPYALTRSHPVEATLDLNQWVRFDQPGDYTVTLTSGCVFPRKGTGRQGLTASIALHIVAASQEWQAQKLKEIQDHRSRGQTIQDAQAWETAVLDLRYLATPAAIDEMTLRLGETDQFAADDCHMGLAGLPPELRQTAIDSMNKRIEEPDFPVTQVFFSTLSFLHVEPGSDQKSIAEQIKAVHPVLWSSIYQAVWKKQREARAQTVQTLLWYQSQVQSPEIELKVSSLLQASFLDLDQNSQIEDLSNRWDRLNTPAFLPVLQSLARLPDSQPEDGFASLGLSGLKGYALMRWYELDPQGAHAEILKQIGTATPTLRAESLEFLPDEQLPQFETAWSDAFLASQNQLEERLLGGLLVRFGSGAAADRMLSKLSQPGKSLCDPHLYALAYLARFRPDSALPLLRKEIADVPARCDENVFRDLTQIVQAPAINDLAIAELDNPNPVIVRDAVDYLRLYGRPQDREPLWKRYLRWAEEHKGANGTVSGTDYRSFLAFVDLQLGEMLGEALIANQGWLVSPELAAKVLAHCTTKEACTGIRQRLDRNAAPYEIYVPDTFTFDEIEDLYPETVAQYQIRSFDLFEQKIAQFPPGSHFTFFDFRPQGSDEQKLARRVADILQKHSMVLDQPTQ
jgi:hypothetical protein